MASKKNKWIQKAQIKKGALHRQLGYSSGKDIPEGLMKDIQKANIGTHVRGHLVTTKLKRRVNFAMNARKWH